ncbi:MAG: hypothetical protein QJR01_04185 [Kyrpidia sp.]|nr:hypothetical protein [Kyrpidia sp.]
MNQEHELLVLLRVQEKLLGEMLALGEEILQGAARGLALEQVLALSDSRKKVFEQVEQTMSPDELPLVDLLDHPNAEIQEKAGQVKDQFEAVMDQDRRLRQTFVNLLGEVGDALLNIQQSLKAEKTYRPGGPTADGIFFDRRR